MRQGRSWLEVADEAVASVQRAIILPKKIVLPLLPSRLISTPYHCVKLSLELKL